MLRSPQASGRYSQADGWLVALGGTEEKARVETLGVAARAGTRAFDRSTGDGRVDAADGDYSDALSKGYGTTLLVAETSGAISAAFDAMLRRYGRLAQSPSVHDYTEYGDSAASTRSFYHYHLAAHATALVFADVTTILNDAQHRSFTLAHGIY